MKKIVVFMLFMLLPNISLGEETDLTVGNALSGYEAEIVDFGEANENDEFVVMAKQMLPVYENMKTCSPSKNQYLEVFGMENDLCHFKYIDYYCYVPLSVAEEYAKLGIKFMRKFFTGDGNNDSPENVRIVEILSNPDYCVK